MTQEWDAATYDRVSGPQVEWARKVLGRLELRGDETVLDAGCGSGRVTAMLLERLPDGHVIAVDKSEAMVEHTREALGERATVLQQDLVDLSLPREVDVVFSNAVFHWVLDHDRLFARLHVALEPGGRLVAQCGGAGNAGRFFRAADEVAAEPPFHSFLGGWNRPWYFAGPDETAERLRDAGFDEVRTWLEPGDVRPEDPADYIRTVCLLHHVDRLPEELRDPYVERVVERMPDTLDYVRLNMEARA